MTKRVTWKSKISLLGSMLLLANHAHSMTFEVVNMKGEPAILGSGEVIAGDAARLKIALTPKARHSLGYYALVLDSPGGSVKSAFEIAEVMDSHRVNTYVAPGGYCVSACAAIVFIAGREHVAVQGSHLGFHGCFDVNTRRIESICNEAIANHASSHGTAYGAVMAYIEKTPSEKIVWIDSQDADCWGINKYDISPEPSNYLSCVAANFRSFKQ